MPETTTEATDALPAAPADLRSGRVLLAEDEASFREILTDFLTESGYTVVPVQSGVEGIREVLAADFAVILCDLMMPGVPGETFYRAVERARPHLCRRFIFMTGHRCDERTNDFIGSISGFVLRKPFQLEKLLDACAFAEVRGTYQSLFESGPDAAPVPPHPAEMPRQAEAISLPRVPAPTLSPAPVRDSAPGPDPEPPKPLREAPASQGVGVASPARNGGRSVFRFLPWAAVVVALAAVPVSRYLDLRARVAVSSVELQFHEEQWAITSARLRKAEERRSGAEAAVNRAREILAHYHTPGCAQALASVTKAAGTTADLQTLEFRGDPEDPATFRLRITGLCAGVEPRATADHLRSELERNLNREFAPKGMTARFEHLEEASPPSSELPAPSERQAAFAIIAQVEGSEPR